MENPRPKTRAESKAYQEQLSKFIEISGLVRVQAIDIYDGLYRKEKDLQRLRDIAIRRDLSEKEINKFSANIQEIAALADRLGCDFILDIQPRGPITRIKQDNIEARLDWSDTLTGIKNGVLISAILWAGIIYGIIKLI